MQFKHLYNNSVTISFFVRSEFYTGHLRKIFYATYYSLHLVTVWNK